MDGTLGSQTAWMLDGTGVRITSGEELAELVRAAAAAGWPVGSPRDRRPRQPRGARRVRGDARRLAAARTPPADRARAVPRPGRPRRASRSSASPARCSSATRPPIATSPSGSGPTGLDGAYAFRSLLDGCGRGERLGRAGRGARPARGDSRRRAPHDRRATRVAPGAGADRRAGAARRRPSPRLARRGRAAPRQAAARLPRRPGRALDRDPVTCPVDELPTVEVVATMVGGRWVHNPPPWD